MLVHITWQGIDISEASVKRNMEVFGKWQPPAGFEFKGFWAYADGTGGAAVAEVDSAASIGKAIAPFTPWLKFEVKPIVPMEDAVGIIQEGIAFRDSIY